MVLPPWMACRAPLRSGAMQRTAGQWMVLVVAIVGVGLVTALPATSQEPTTSTSVAVSSGTSMAVTADAVAAAVAAEGWYADEASGVDRSALAALAHRLSAEDEPIGVAVLAAEPVGSSPVFAEQVLVALPSQGESAIETMAVLSPADVGVVSDVWADEAVDAAVDESIDALRSDPVTGLDRLADALADQEAADDQGSGGGSFPVAIVAIVGGVIIAVVALGRRLSPGTFGSGSGSRWGSSSSRRRSWRRAGHSSSFRRSGGGGSRRSSRRSSRGRGGRRL